VALVRERTIPTEQPPLVGVVITTFAYRRASRSQRCASPTAVISAFYTGAATFSSKLLQGLVPFEILGIHKRPPFGLVVRVPGYRTEMYCVSCEVRTEFIYVM
jgi:hypothetical protein